MTLRRFTPALLVLLAPLTTTLAAQDPAIVEALAPILAAEDRRVLDLAVLGPALEHPDVGVRRTAVVAVGRIGDPRGVELLVPRLRDRDGSVVADAFFALGLLKSPAGVAPIMERLRLPDSLSAAALQEAATALVRTGGDDATRLVADVIGGSGDLRLERRDAMRGAAMLESWRLGGAAPVEAILPFARDTSLDLRWRAHYALGRLGTPRAAEAMLTAVRDRSALVREVAARSLTRRFADTAGLSPDHVRTELTRLLDDESAGVRINALGALASHRDSATSAAIARLLRDADRNVRVAAAGALVQAGGHDAVVALAAAFDAGNEAWGVRRAALLGIARLDTAAFRPRADQWLGSPSPFDRMVALEGWGTVRGADPGRFQAAERDADARVRAAALSAWRASAGRGDADLAAAAERAWTSGEPALRRAALPILSDSATDATLDLLTTAWQGQDGELREAALNALIRLSRGDRAFLSRLTTPGRRSWLERPDDPVLRGIALRGFAPLSARWGGVAPIETGRTLQDYRELAARFLLARENPRVVMDVEGRGRIEVELLPREAPLTVANFLRLVDRRYFDNSRWHRVVPNFVVQDGDPTGTGSGGPGWAIRDEINRQRYVGPMLGMALSGPDTGGSQWFINLSPQPHLDGGYTIFGRVTGGASALMRVVQGDVIRSIQRGTAP